MVLICGFAHIFRRLSSIWGQYLHPPLNHSHHRSLTDLIQISPNHPACPIYHHLQNLYHHHQTIPRLIHPNHHCPNLTHLDHHLTSLTQVYHNLHTSRIHLIQRHRLNLTLLDHIKHTSLIYFKQILHINLKPLYHNLHTIPVHILCINLKQRMRL